MLFVVAAFSAYFVLVSYRALALTPPVSSRAWRLHVVLAGSLIADLVASYGFYQLIGETPAQIRHYSLIVTVLALLAAVAIVGKFAFPREPTARFRRLSGWALSLFVMWVLYLLFGSISYYSKIVQDSNFSPVADVFIPTVMLAILWIVTAYDHWDAAEQTD